MILDLGWLELDTSREWEKESEDDYGPETPVPIFQHAWEFEQLLELYRGREPARVLEIGTYHGGSLYHWLTASPQPPELVVAVDTYREGVDNRALYDDWRHEDTRLMVYEANSRDPVTVDHVREGAPYDWIWIDAGHYYPEVADDWRNYSPMVEEGGVIALHDILPPNERHPEIEVDRLWREVQRQGWLTQEIVANPGNSWGGIGVVYA